MGTKLKIKGNNQVIELPRGASIPRDGDVVYITLRGEKDERLYTVDLVEHEFNFNMALPVGQCIITLKEVKPKKKKSGD